MKFSRARVKGSKNKAYQLTEEKCDECGTKIRLTRLEKRKYCIKCGEYKDVKE